MLTLNQRMSHVTVMIATTEPTAARRTTGTMMIGMQEAIVATRTIETTRIASEIMAVTGTGNDADDMMMKAATTMMIARGRESRCWSLLGDPE
jgi:hypothetical protein